MPVWPPVTLASRVHAPSRNKRLPRSRCTFSRHPTCPLFHHIRAASPLSLTLLRSRHLLSFRIIYHAPGSLLSPFRAPTLSAPYNILAPRLLPHSFLLPSFATAILLPCLAMPAPRLCRAATGLCTHCRTARTPACRTTLRYGLPATATATPVPTWIPFLLCRAEELPRHRPAAPASRSL